MVHRLSSPGACGVLVPDRGSNLCPPCSPLCWRRILNHWTTREVSTHNNVWFLVTKGMLASQAQVMPGDSWVLALLSSTWGCGLGAVESGPGPREACPCLWTFLSTCTYIVRSTCFWNHDPSPTLMEWEIQPSRRSCLPGIEAGALRTSSRILRKFVELGCLCGWLASDKDFVSSSNLIKSNLII